jgi:hypothetical protein
MKKIIITVQLCVIVNLLNAQITTNEQPYSWKNLDSLIIGKGDVIVLPIPDKVRIENEDKINDQEQVLCAMLILFMWILLLKIQVPGKP